MLAWFLGSRVGRWVMSLLAGAAAAGTIAVTIWRAGARSARKDAQIVELKKYQGTRKEMDNADVSTGDAADDDAWLRERAERKRDL